MNTCTGMMTFPNLKECWTQASAFLLEFRLNNSIKFLRERSKEKDFIEDLKMRKDI